MGLHLKRHLQQVGILLQGVPIGRLQNVSLTDALSPLTGETLELLDMAEQQIDGMREIISMQHHVVSLMRTMAVVPGELTIHPKNNLLKLFDDRQGQIDSYQAICKRRDNTSLPKQQAVSQCNLW